MERKSNVTVWQLRLFEGFDKDIFVMQRDEQEVFDDALHVFFEKEYYDSYVNKAKKYSKHRYAYHEDKLGEVVNQIFEENIAGLVLHMVTAENMMQKNYSLCEERYLSAEDLQMVRDVAHSYHNLFTASIARMPKEQAVAALWNKNVYIIGQLPDFTKKPDVQQTFELMTIRRKHDGSLGTAEDFDYESLKVFLTPESAMRFNPDKKAVNRYKLGLLAQFVKGKLQVIIEPHRNYYVEFDPATIDISSYYQRPEWDKEKVVARIREFVAMEEVYVLLASAHSDYRTNAGTPLIVRMSENNLMLYIFERYEDAKNFVMLNPGIAPILDGVYPIGKAIKNHEQRNLNLLLAIANAMGVHNVNMDMESDRAVGCQIPFFMESAGMEADLKKLVTANDYEQIVTVVDGKEAYRMPVLSFVEEDHSYEVSEERKTEILKHLAEDSDLGVAFATTCTLPEMIYMLNQAGIQFDAARKANYEEKTKKLNRMMNMMTIPITDSILERPFIYTLRYDDGSFSLKNNFAYLLITNRFETGRSGEGKLSPASIDNEGFMEKLEEASKIAVLTDGPNGLCLIDVHLMSEVVKQRKKQDSMMEEILIYMTQGLGMKYADAVRAYNHIKIDGDIYVEFISCMRNGEYSPRGMVTVDDYTAKRIAEEMGCNPVEAYCTLIDRKYYGDQKPESFTKKEKTNVEVSKPQQQMDEKTVAEGTEEKKSFLGKLFKK